MKIGLVTCHKEAELTAADRSLIPIFELSNVEVVPVIWDDPKVTWRDFDQLVVRSVWDYHLKSNEFLRWLDYLDEYEIPLLNTTSIIRSNHHKFYLQKLEESGISIVPTLFVERSDNFSLDNILLQDWNQAVIKPAISASSYLTETFTRSEIDEIENRFKDFARTKDFLVQQFMPEVQTFGELSILFFNRNYSHTVLKTAKKDEFRVQSEYGGLTKLIDPDNEIIQQAANVLAQFDGDILQARVDGIIRDDKFVLMEVELIEPHLFFEFRKESIDMFVEETMRLIEKSAT